LPDKDGTTLDDTTTYFHFKDVEQSKTDKFHFKDVEQSKTDKLKSNKFPEIVYRGASNLNPTTYSISGNGFFRREYANDNIPQPQEEPQLVYKILDSLESVLNYTKDLASKSVGFVKKTSTSLFGSLKDFYQSEIKKLNRKIRTKEPEFKEIVTEENSEQSLDASGLYRIPMPEKQSMIEKKKFSQDIIDQFESMSNDIKRELNPSKFAFAIYDRETGQYYGHNDQEIISAPCLNKAAAAFAVAYYAQNGLLDLNQKVEIQEDLVLYRERLDFGKFKRKGATVYLRNLVRFMNERSIETSLNHILYTLGEGDVELGKERVNSLMESLDFSSIKINDLHLPGNNYDSNVSNAETFVRFMDFIGYNDVLNPEYSGFVRSTLQQERSMAALKEITLKGLPALFRPTVKEDGLSLAGLIDERYSLVIMMDGFKYPITKKQYETQNGKLKITNAFTESHGFHAYNKGITETLETFRSIFYENKMKKAA